MLKPEIARQQLESLKSKKHVQGRLNRIPKLPKPQAAIALGLFGRNADGKEPEQWQEQRKLKNASAVKLTGDSKLRGRILSTLLPTIHADVEAGWQLLTRLPYTVGHLRRAFRLPGRPEAYRAKAQTYLEHVLDCVEQYPDDALTSVWLARWAVHLSWRVDSLGYLFAGVIDQEGPEAAQVLEILKDSAANRHEIGGPGGHAARGLLRSSRPEAWEFVENLLLAAQRQEGLRQTILEAVDEAHPEAFRRMIRVVLDQNLIRFASVARAAGVWLGEVQTVEDPKKLKAALQTINEMLSDPSARKAAIAKGDPATAYRALWGIAFQDAAEAVKAATPLLSEKVAGRRFAAAKLVIETELPESPKLVMPLLNDSDPCVVSLAVGFAAQIARADDDVDDPFVAAPPKDLFERLEKIIPKLPEKPKELTAPVEGWFVPSLAQETAANALVECIGNRRAERLLPYLPLMGPYARVSALAKLCEPRTLTTKVKQTLLAIAGEPHRQVREAALKYLKLSKLAEDEVRTLEGYLTRKTPDFRRSVFELLLNRNDRLALGTIDRLLDAADANCRAAGIEISRRTGMTSARPRLFGSAFGPIATGKAIAWRQPRLKRSKSSWIRPYGRLRSTTGLAHLIPRTVARSSSRRSEM